jgi:hypothetical protein
LELLFRVIGRGIFFLGGGGKTGSAASSSLWTEVVTPGSIAVQDSVGVHGIQPRRREVVWRVASPGIAASCCGAGERCYKWLHHKGVRHSIGARKRRSARQRWNTWRFAAVPGNGAASCVTGKAVYCDHSIPFLFLFFFRGTASPWRGGDKRRLTRTGDPGTALDSCSAASPSWWYDPFLFFTFEYPFNFFLTTHSAKSESPSTRVWFFFTRVGYSFTSLFLFRASSFFLRFPVTHGDPIYLINSIVFCFIFCF